MARSASQVQEELRQPAEMQLRKQLAAAARSINWSYALFWSTSSTQPGMLTWTDGFYNGEVKTRKISKTVLELTSDQLDMQRSEQLRELYEALLSGECDRRTARARPVCSLSPEDLCHTEWYYMVSMTYAFGPGQGLPGRSLASNEHVWLCNAHLASSKVFPRVLLAKGAFIKTIVCIPLMRGVLELGTTDKVLEDPDLVSRATTAFWELQRPTYLEAQEPNSHPPSPDETGDVADVVVFEDVDDNAMDMETMTATTGGHGQELELGEAEECLSNNASLDDIMKQIDEFYSLCDEMDVQPLDVGWIIDDIDGSNLHVPSCLQLQPAHPARAPTAVHVVGTSSASADDGSHVTNIVPLTMSSPQSCKDESAALLPVIKDQQELLEKVVVSRGTTGTTKQSGIKNHVMTERKRRENLSEMFLILKSLVPSVHKLMGKASILAETIAYLKELERKVQELESSRDLLSRPSETARLPGKSPDFSGDADDVEQEPEHEHYKDGATSNLIVTISDRDVLLKVQCRWEELLRARVLDAIKGLHLDVLSVQASAPEDGFMGLNIRAQFAGSSTIVPGVISEALGKAIGKQ